MMRRGRRNFRVGDHLVVDDESGFVHYASEMKECWDGTIRRADQYETRHPQEFVRAKGDPYPVSPIRPEGTFVITDEDAALPLEVGNTSVDTKVGAATHIYRHVVNDRIVLGIGDMVIEGVGAEGFQVE